MVVRVSASNLAFVRLGIALAGMQVISSGAGLSRAAGADSSLTAVPAQETPQDFTRLDLDQLMSIKVPLVYGASMHEQKVTDAPSSVTIVTADEIKAYGHRTLADILRSVRGFYVNYDRVYSFIGVRGFNRPSDFGGRILITVDGHRINEPIYDQAFNGNEGIIDVDLIERVEVIRGPGSALYGNNAFFAVVNIVTKHGQDMDGVEGSVSYGSYETYTGRFSYGKRFHSGLELLVSGTYFTSEGHEQLFFPAYSYINHGIADHLDGVQGGTLFASASYNDFSLEGGLMARSKDVPSAAYGSVFNKPENAYDQRSFADFKYRHIFGEDLRVMARVYYDHYRYDGSYTFGAANYPVNPTVTNNMDLNYAHSIGVEVQAQRPLWEKHLLTIGVDYQHDIDILLRNVDLNPPVTYLHNEHSPDSVGVYAQDEFAIRTNLLLNAGLRYDYFTTFGDTVNGRGAIIYQPFSKTSLKLFGGTAYHAPNANQLYYNANIYEVNPSIRPEKIRSIELAWEQGLDQHLRSTFAIFYNQIRDLITQQQDPKTSLFYYGNTESVDSYGLEAELEGHWAYGWESRVSYTLQKTKDNATHEDLPNSPRHLAKFNLLAPLVHEKLFAGVEVQGMSTRLTEHGTATSGFWIANATLLSRNLVKGLEISVSVYNLFDKRYSDPISKDYAQDDIPQDDRNFRLKLTYRF